MKETSVFLHSVELRLEQVVALASHWDGYLSLEANRAIRTAHFISFWNAALLMCIDIGLGLWVGSYLVERASRVVQGLHEHDVVEVRHVR